MHGNVTQLIEIQYTKLKIITLLIKSNPKSITMRKLFLLVAISFLLQSCFSYRIDTKPNEMIVGKKYKIQRGNKSSKVLVKSINDSTVVVKKNWEEKQIPLKEITQAKKRKFSVIKTIALPTTIAVVAVGIFALTYSGPSVGFDGFTLPNK